MGGIKGCLFRENRELGRFIAFSKREPPFDPRSGQNAFKGSGHDETIEERIESDPFRSFTEDGENSFRVESSVPSEKDGSSPSGDVRHQGKCQYDISTGGLDALLGR